MQKRNKNNRGQWRAVCFSALLVTIWMAVASAPSRADMFGGDTAVLTKLYDQYLKQIKIIKDQLKELKETNDTLFEARDELEKLRKEYEFASNFDPDEELRKLISEADDLTNIDEIMDAKTFEQKYALLSKELDRRFSRSQHPGDIVALNAIDKVQTELKYRGKQRSMFSEESINMNSGNNITQKDIDIRIASASMLAASLLAEKRIHELEKELAQKEKFLGEVQRDKDFLNYLAGD